MDIPENLSNFYEIDTAYQTFCISEYIVEKLQEKLTRPGYILKFTKKLARPFNLNKTLIDFFESGKLRHRISTGDNFPRQIFTLKCADPVAILKDVESGSLTECFTLQVSVGIQFQEIDSIGLPKWKVQRPIWMREEEQDLTVDQKFHPDVSDDEYEGM